MATSKGRNIFLPNIDRYTNKGRKREEIFPSPTLIDVQIREGKGKKYFLPQHWWYKEIREGKGEGRERERERERAQKKLCH